MFIVLEGLDACGKASQIALLAGELERAGLDFIVTADLYKTDVGVAVRNIFSAPDASVCSEAETYLITAARLQNIHELIAPALAQGKLVLCDRWVDSTYAYQVHGRGADAEFFATHCDDPLPIKPDLVLYLKADRSVLRGRMLARGDLDGIERMPDEFFARVELGYEERLKSGRVTAVDAAGTRDEVFARICSALSGLIPELSVKS